MPLLSRKPHKIAAVPDLDRVAEALFIRQFEMSLLDLHKEGEISGTVHTCVGQEGPAVALHRHLRPGIDAFFASHRGHGHYLAHGGSPEGLLAELMGREGAICEGRGGTQHLSTGRFYSNGIQGAGTLQAVGFAWRQRLGRTGAIAVAQMGDGTFGEGAVYEALNFAALLQAPVLFLVEANGWAQSTDVTLTTAGTLEDRAAAFGIPWDRRDDLDWQLLSDHLGAVVARVRQSGPFLQIVDTRRLLAHSKGDDDRPAALLAAQEATDPLGRWLRQNGAAGAVRQRVADRLTGIVHDVKARPKLSDLGGDALPSLRNPPSAAEIRAKPSRNQPVIVQQLNGALHAALEENADVILLGEDLADPYGGAFKVTRGLSTAFGERVLSTPIAENGIAGLAVGAALAGGRPVAEIMFADFVTLAADQLINSAAKMHYMYGGKTTCPLTLRLVSGGGRGYGPTHSQSTERLLCGEPGLRVVALSRRHDPRALLRHVILEDDAPTIFVENKLLYGQPVVHAPPLMMQPAEIPGSAAAYPPLVYRPVEDMAGVTIVAYGAAAGLAEEALEWLMMEHEVAADLVIMTQIWPLDLGAVIASAERTRRLLVIDPSVADYGFGAAVLSGIVQSVSGLHAKAVGARALPIPSARGLEDRVLPGPAEVKAALSKLLGLA